ncbi:MAG TPA: 6-phosphogluconolactonase [Pyrinomonadaceae bacterium]|jgi:galactosamine-6-phosphate isomerase|nr:6-phosphogluconolactonase [Pyrinomonadaceae bacterium]
MGDDFKDALIACETEAEIGRRCAEIIVEEVRRKPSLLLCAATGASPTLAYRLLAEKKKEEPSLFRELRVLKLDEWQGLPMDDAGTSETYLRKYLIGPLEISADRYFSFASDAADPQRECAKIADVLRAQGPIDLSVLGVGANGHLAMNEPAVELTPGPHLAELSEATRQHPMIQHIAIPPRHGITLGVSDLMRSQKIVVIIQGEAKREVVRRLLSGGISTTLPVSLLRLRENVTCICHRSLLPTS